MKHQEKGIKTVKLNIKKAGFLIFSWQVLLLNSWGTLPAMAATEEPLLSIVYSQENANQWTGITSRLQATGVKYCVIPLGNVKSAADWGDRRVLFLPNVEVLTPTQAIALEEWVSKGGRLIASGPVGGLSAPGVRQLLRTLFGGYWGFTLNETQQLQPPKIKTQQWANQKELFGTVHGGVVVPDNSSSEATAVWNAKDSPAAVLSTERSTLLGWRWGVDTASTPDLDNAWLKASLNHHLKVSSNGEKKIAGGAQNCETSLAAVVEKQTAINSSAPKSPPPLSLVLSPHLG